MAENTEKVPLWKESVSKKAAEGERENFLKLFRGEQPEWVPNYNDSCMWVFTDFTYYYLHEDLVDCFGVKWVNEDQGEMHDPNRPLLDDITKWRDWVSFPDPDTADWEAIAKMDLEYYDPNKAMSYAPCASDGTLFMPLMGMMGFEDGLCAMLEEPEACHEMFDEFTTIIEKAMRAQIPLYNPDFVYFNDDLASLKGPFISMDVFEELLAPYYQRLFDVAKEFDKPIIFHMCGKCECFIERLHEMGITGWEVAQTINDLAGLKAKYGNSLVLIGAWDTQGPAGQPGADEETVRQSVRDSIDSFAPGGGFSFWTGGPVGSSEDMLTKIDWAENEANTYGREFYKKNQ